MENEVHKLQAAGKVKDAQKLVGKLESLVKEQQKHEKEYQDSVTRLAAFQVEYVEKMSGVLEFLQIQEEQRIEHVRENFIKFVEVQERMAPALGQANQKIKKAVQSIDKNKDIREVIKTFGTGSTKPTAPKFEPYKKASGATGFTVPQVTGVVGAAPAAASPAPAAAAGGGHKSFQARALYDYVAQDGTELNMNANDVITVVATDSSGWWTGLKGAQRGLVPSNYLQKI